MDRVFLGDSFSTDHGQGRCGSRLERELARLDGLVDWERLHRSPGAGRTMRQSVAPARDLLDRLGSPDRELQSILVAGTKGKGSVSSLVATALAAGGERVGLYTSPHVERVGERIRIDGEEIGGDALATVLGEALDVREAAIAERGAAAEATWFDVLTVAAIGAMARAGVGYAVLECGLGGRLDSTRAVTPILSVVTNVSLEHTAVLGSTREAIAWEKAGVASAGAPLVTGLASPDDEAARVVADVAREAGAALVRVCVPAGASIEEENEELAAEVLRQLGHPVPGEPGGLDREGWRAASRLPGRLERILGPEKVVLDGAHVPGSLDRVFAVLQADPALASSPDVVFGCRTDKDLPGLLKVLRGRVDRVHCTSLGRGLDASPERIAGLARSLGLDASAADDPEAALAMARRRAGADRWILVTGSLHLLGRLRPLLVRPTGKRPC
ncbi:MAG TPA: bifunctional folylpolyglutamate synthase/dihydrofolate synthase [Planctomycetes bacterium]|nr:bifunctional folylpolyglutamate synthase/dihydrofolate synthase [Planctomycetota bacterium]